MELLTAIPTQENKTSFLKNLRSATGPKHIALESNELLANLTSAKLTLQQYYYYLVLMKEIEEAYTHMLESFPLLLNISGKTNSAPLITQDISAIHSAGFATISPRAFRLSPINGSHAFLLGFCYVMKGSKLGGKVIYKHVHQYLGLSEQNGASYIVDAGNNTFNDWKRFLTALSDFAIKENCSGEIIAGAIFGFSSISDYFELNRRIYAD